MHAPLKGLGTAGGEPLLDVGVGLDGLDGGLGGWWWRHESRAILVGRTGVSAETGARRKVGLELGL